MDLFRGKNKNVSFIKLNMSDLVTADNSRIMTSTVSPVLDVYETEWTTEEDLKKSGLSPK